jgi:hypothetical protein
MLSVPQHSPPDKAPVLTYTQPTRRQKPYQTPDQSKPVHVMHSRHIRTKASLIMPAAPVFPGPFRREIWYEDIESGMNAPVSHVRRRFFGSSGSFDAQIDRDLALPVRREPPD